MQKDMADELLDTADIFEINKLTAEELLSEEKIKYIFAIDNPVQKQKVLNQFEERAKKSILRSVLLSKPVIVL